jgi:hypothetical protein
MKILFLWQKEKKHNYFKSIGTELAEFPNKIPGFRVRPIVKPIFSEQITIYFTTVSLGNSLGTY